MPSNGPVRPDDIFPFVTARKPGDVVDFADWAVFRDLDRLRRAAGMRVVGEMVLEHARATLTRSELEVRIRRYLAAFCPLKERK